MVCTETLCACLEAWCVCLHPPTKDCPCVPPATGTHGDGFGCTTCPAGQFSNIGGSCEPCPKGTYSSAGEWVQPRD